MARKKIMVNTCRHGSALPSNVDLQKGILFYAEILLIPEVKLRQKTYQNKQQDLTYHNIQVSSWKTRVLYEKTVHKDAHKHGRGLSSASKQAMVTVNGRDVLFD